MPTYEYQCDACGRRFDKFQSITAKPLKKCELCGKPRARRLLSAGAGLIFKGSGFYITDYRDSSYKEKAKAESGASDAKSDSKPDAAKSDTAKPDASKSDKKPEAKAPASKSEKLKKK